MVRVLVKYTLKLKSIVKYFDLFPTSTAPFIEKYRIASLQYSKVKPFT